MRIDHALCQKILIAIEGDPDAGTGKLLQISVEGYAPDAIAHHVKYLRDTDLITGQVLTHNQSPYPEIGVQDITPAGRRYLDENETQPRNKIGF